MAKILSNNEISKFKEDGAIFLKELITPKVLIALIAVIIGIYLVKKSNKNDIVT